MGKQDQPPTPLREEKVNTDEENTVDDLKPWQFRVNESTGKYEVNLPAGFIEKPDDETKSRLYTGFRVEEFDTEEQVVAAIKQAKGGKDDGTVKIAPGEEEEEPVTGGFVDQKTGFADPKDL